MARLDEHGDGYREAAVPYVWEVSISSHFVHFTMIALEYRYIFYHGDVQCCNIIMMMVIISMIKKDLCFLCNSDVNFYIVGESDLQHVECSTRWRRSRVCRSCPWQPVD